MQNPNLLRPSAPWHRWLITLASLVGLLLVTSGLYAQTAVLLAPVPQLQFFDQSGRPLAFGCVFTYQNNSVTPLATYTDSTGTTQNANPVILTAGGSANVWIQAGVAYSFRLKTFGGANCASGSTLYTVNGIGGGLSTLTTIVAYSATPLFTDAAQNQLFQITLTGNASSQPLTAVGIVAPGLITWQITQDGAGGHTFSWPANVTGGCTIGAGVSQTTLQHFVWNGVSAIATGPCVTGNGPIISAGNIFDYGLSASAVVCTDTNKQLAVCAGGISSVTYNGQTVAPGGSGNVNNGAAAHSLALNQAAGSVFTGLTLGAHQVAVGIAAADPVAKTVPDCQDTSGNHLNYTQSTDLFGCGTSVPGVTKDFSQAGCTPASSTDSQCTGSITISPAFADASYIPQLTVNNNGTAQNAQLLITVNGALMAGSIPYTLTCTFYCSPVNAPTIYVHAFHP